jgi:plasmid maintenance system antidote protein VapI
MYFESLQLRLIALVHERVRRGELTERGLARLTGISQPHLHNMLKGARVLSPPMADLILHQLHITVMDLIESGEPSRPNRRP